MASVKYVTVPPNSGSMAEARRRVFESSRRRADSPPSWTSTPSTRSPPPPSSDPPSPTRSATTPTPSREIHLSLTLPALRSKTRGKGQVLNETSLWWFNQDLNTNIEMLDTRGSISKYVLPDENLKGRMSITFDEAMSRVACNLESPGYHVLCKATEEVWLGM